MAVKQKVILFFMVPSRQLGGCTSFTVHLYRALAAMGYAPVIVRVARAKTTTPTQVLRLGNLWLSRPQTA